MRDRRLPHASLAGTRRISPWAIGCGLALIVFALSHRLDSPPLLEDPNDGQYAEVAREMLESGEWISPQLNYVLFLNKPPLLYWLVAAAYRFLGVSELAARLPGVLFTALAILLIYCLGRELFDPLTGLLAACVYASMPSTLLEARLVRPDTLLTTATLGALLAFAVAARSTGVRRRRALYALQLALAVGVMAKGAVALLLPGFPIATLMLVERRRDLLSAFASPRGWLLFVALVLPWHLVAAVRHSGFALDYVVNQHLLFFFDRKLPRDSIPITLAQFWGAFLARTFPWLLLLPLALLRAGRRLGPRLNGDPRTLFIVIWGAGVLVFFSAASSRLEHYCLPALPAVALLIGALLRDAADLRSPWRRSILAHVGALSVLAALGFWLVPPLLRGVGWLGDTTALAVVARACFAALAAGSLLAVLVGRRHPVAIAPLLSLAILLLTPLIHRGFSVFAAFNSSAPTALILREATAADAAEVVFEAPTEYQHVAGMIFYLRRRITLLRPQGFVPPPYLAPHVDQLFIDRAELAERWRNSRVLFVSNPLAPPARALEEVVPGAYYVVARLNDRWIVSNRPHPRLATGS